MMENFNIPENMPIESGIVSRAVFQAQSKVEGFNFDARKHLLDYDDILNKQRLSVYRKRQEMLEKSTHPQILSVLDLFWMNHLESMEALRESVRIRAYGQHDPLVEYRRESHILYKQMLDGFEKWQGENAERLSQLTTNNLQQTTSPKPVVSHQSSVVGHGKVGRNDNCPCGSGKKYKKCHGM
jgi:preprotein translocase subunit SecA